MRWAHLVCDLNSGEERTDATSWINFQLLAEFQDVVHASCLVGDVSGELAFLLHLQIETPTRRDSLLGVHQCAQLPEKKSEFAESVCTAPKFDSPDDEIIVGEVVN